jgi:hypothetical protein
MKKHSCTRTKCESIILNALAPFEVHQINNELKTFNFSMVVNDTLNLKNFKFRSFLFHISFLKRDLKLKCLYSQM